MKTDSNIIVFETEMSSGHGGRSGRFDSLKQLASQFAFILRLEGIKE
jgi:oligopeptidase B